MDLETRMLVICLTALAVGFVMGVTKVLGAWAEHHISRHDLIVESKQRRIAYFNAVAERRGELNGDEDFEDDGSVIIEEPTAEAA